MRSDDEGFASRQVAEATILTNASLLTPIPYRTTVFDVSKFSSIAFYMNPTAASGYPLYVTIEWWTDRLMGTLVTRDVVSWMLPGSAQSRLWQGQIPCRSDFCSVTLDSTAAGSLGLIVIGQTRDLSGKITQQVAPSAGGLAPFALVYDNQNLAAGPANGVPIYCPPWFGEVEITVHCNAAGGVATYTLIRNVGASALGPPDETGMSLTAGTGTCVGFNGVTWNKYRLAMNGQQLQLLHGSSGGGASTWVTQIQPLTGL